MKTCSILLAAVAALLVTTLASPLAVAASTVTFDNKSGQPALVKLEGPTAKSVAVQTGEKSTVEASPGHYFIKTRYGTPGNYSYSKGDEFDVVETATSSSRITITLHKVVDGNYQTRPITADEFGELAAQSVPEREGANTKPKRTVAQTTPAPQIRRMTASSEDTAPWATNFPAFLQELATIIGPNPKWPQRAPGLGFEAKNDKDETVALLSQFYPIPEFGSSSSKAASTSMFAWKSVTWDLTIDSIEGGKAGNVIINFKKPEAGSIHPSIKEFNVFRAVVAESERGQARKLKGGQQVRVRGQIDGNIMRGLSLFLGVGPDAGNIKMNLVLSNAELLYSKGDEFDVKDTATTASDIRITLHKIVAGNDASKAISEFEVGTDAAAKQKLTPKQGWQKDPAAFVKEVQQLIDDGGLTPEQAIKKLLAGGSAEIEWRGRLFSIWPASPYTGPAMVEMQMDGLSVRYQKTNDYRISRIGLLPVGDKWKKGESFTRKPRACQEMSFRKGRLFSGRPSSHGR